MNMKQGVADWQPKTASGSMKKMLTPNAKDNPDSLTPTNELKQTIGKSGKPPAPFGKKGREF